MFVLNEAVKLEVAINGTEGACEKPQIIHIHY